MPNTDSACVEANSRPWSDDPAWHARISSGRRELSTNHLMGPGYWVWLIPLASDSISIGIVADAQTHPFDGFNRFERALDWLRRREPQCASAVEQHLDVVLAGRGLPSDTSRLR